MQSTNLITLQNQPNSKKATFLTSIGSHSTRVIFLIATIISVSFSLQAQALTVSQSVDFTAAEQSMWGPGGSVASFRARDNGDFGILSYSYDFGASSGSVSASFNGILSLDYLPLSSTKRPTSLSLSFLGDPNGGRIKSDLGAWAKFNALGFELLNKDYGLNIDKTFTPKLDAAISGIDDFPFVGSSVNLGIAMAGVSLNIEQESLFLGTGITGELSYSLRGSGIERLMPFSLGTDAGLTLDLTLQDAGLWDFSLANLRLVNEFSPSFDANLELWEEHVDGIRTCRRCIWGLCVPLPCGFNYDRNELELASINVYDRDPFALSFATTTNSQRFSIRVIPEPDTLALLIISLVGLVGVRLSRAATPHQLFRPIPLKQSTGSGTNGITLALRHEAAAVVS